MLHDHICATLGFEKLLAHSPENIRQMLHPDCDTSVNDLFEIIEHIRKHEGIRLEVKAHSEETAATQSA